MATLKLSMSHPRDFVSGTWILDSNRNWDSGFLVLFSWVTDHSPSFRACVFSLHHVQTVKTMNHNNNADFTDGVCHPYDVLAQPHHLLPESIDKTKREVRSTLNVNFAQQLDEAHFLIFYKQPIGQ